LVGATYGLGFLIGPASAGLLVRLGYHAPFWAAAALGLLTIVLTLAILPESRGPVSAAPSLAAIRASLRSPVLGRLILTQFAFAIAFTSWVSVFALFAERVLGYGPSQTAWIFIVSGAVGIVVQAGLIGRLVDAFGEGRVAIAGFLCAIVAYAGVGLVTTTPLLAVFVVLWALSGALIRPALGSLISAATPADQRGTILSINDSLSNVAFVIAPLVATTVLGVNPHVSGIAPAIFAALGLALGYRLFASPDERSHAS
jgi:DHA1 family tetracycline resistance protein-like MFS transporter